MTRFMKYRAMLVICAALGWWGIWFPELAVQTEAVCVVEENGQKSTVQQGKKVLECGTVQEICDGLRHADKEQIQVRCRIFMLVEQYLHKK